MKQYYLDIYKKYYFKFSAEFLRGRNEIYVIYFAVNGGEYIVKYFTRQLILKTAKFETLTTIFQKCIREFNRYIIIEKELLNHEGKYKRIY